MKQIIAVVVALAPLVYSLYLLVKVHNIKSNSDTEELERQDSNIKRMQKSSSIFLFVAVFMIYQYFKSFWR